jgi:large subunit ribosomal protein L21
MHDPGFDRPALLWYDIRLWRRASAWFRLPPAMKEWSVYAVVETGGKQYRVAVGQEIDVEKLDGEDGAEVTLDRVLLVATGEQVSVGSPLVEGARVLATIEQQAKADKIVVFKFRAKKRYRRKRGHRQLVTRLRIREIIA